jgi:thioredoxin 1
MKKGMGFLILLGIFLFFFNSCGGAEPKTSDQPGSAQSAKAAAKVTFIELGSLNCIPCKMMQPIMRELEQKFPRDVKVVFHDVWTPQGEPFGRQFGIRVIPTQVFLDAEGKEYFRHEGFFSMDQLLPVLQRKGVKE